MILRRILFLVIFLIYAVISQSLEAAKPPKYNDDLIRGKAKAPISKNDSAFLCYYKEYTRPANRRKFFPLEAFCVYFTSERR